MIKLIIIETNGEGARLEETKALCSSAGAEVVGVLFQTLREVTPATYIGKGKVEELAGLVEETGADTVLFDGELSPSQTLNISDIVGKPVITRTNLILDIFAKRAESAEGKVLAELAQLRYIYPRLKGRGDSLSRLGGGIGTRGPGETKLETDRRHIKSRMKGLEKRLEEIEKRRKLYGERRAKNGVFTVALAGYTNTGKSTLLNRLCGADTFTQNALFATLDPTSRSTQINGKRIVVTDTVGFIKELPCELERAFASTLEQTKTADLIINVASCKDDFLSQFAVTDDFLDKIGASEKRIYALNKCDGVDGIENDKYVCISALTGEGIEKLKEKISVFF